LGFSRFLRVSIGHSSFLKDIGQAEIIEGFPFEFCREAFFISSRI
jgi:hypothetical protein